MVVDPTGAGDSFAGGMMGHIARMGSTDFATLQDALTWGTVMASFTIGGFSLDGLRHATPAAIAQRHVRFRDAARIA